MPPNVSMVNIIVIYDGVFVNLSKLRVKYNNNFFLRLIARRQLDHIK